MAKTVNEKLVDGTLKHLIEVDQLAEEFAEEIAQFLEQDLLPRIGRELQKRSFIAMADDEKLFHIRNILAEQAATEGITGTMLVTLTEFALGEADAVAKMMEEIIPVSIQTSVPAPEQLQSLVMETPFNNRIMTDWFNDLNVEIQNGLMNDIRVAIAEGQDIDTIANNLIKHNLDAFPAGTAKRALQDAKTVARTAVNAVNTGAREMTYAQMAEFIKGVQYLATLDDRTTAICMELHGTVWPLGDGPRPPQHWNCRSTTIPVAKSWEEMGIPATDIDPTVQASMNGQVAGVKSFEDWLKGQDETTQDNLLGPVKADLWRKGQAGNLFDMIGPDGNFLTLNEMGFSRSGKPL